MKIRSLINHPVWILVQLVLIYQWTTVLQATDSYNSVYVLCGLASALCLMDNSVYHDKTLRKKSPVSSYILAGFLSVAVALANYPIFLTYRKVEMIGVTRNIIINAFHLVLTLLGGVIVFFNITSVALRWMDRKDSSAVTPRQGGETIFWCSFAFLAAVYAVNLFLLEYPGNMSADPMAQYEEIITGRFTSAHPYWHTMLMKSLFSVGNFLFHDVNASIAFFNVCQLLFVSACFSYVLVTLYQAGMPKWFIGISFCLYCFQPYNIALSITLWKDVPFSVAALLFVVGLFRCVCDIGHNRRLNYVTLFIGGFLLCSMRTNGLFTYGVTALIICLFLWKKDKKFVIIIVGIFLLSSMLCGPIVSDLTVDNTDYVETFSIPMQQVARVVADGCELTSQQDDLLGKIVDIDKISDVYLGWISDPIKTLIRNKDSDYFNEHINIYGKLWFELGLKYPWEYLKAWVDQTKGYWNGGYDYYQYAEMIYDNDLGIEKAGGGNPLLVRMKYLYFGMIRFSSLFEPLNSIGLHVWIMVLCLYLNVHKRRDTFLLCVPSLVIIGGLLLCTPVYSEFRYAYAVFITLPLVLGATFFTPDQPEVIIGKD